MKEALTSFNLLCEPIEKKEIKQSIGDYAQEQAFICHSVDHWIAIRRLHGTWYNLNSTNMVPPGPQIISDFYLAAFLDSIKHSGYTIFVVRGELPLAKRQSVATGMTRKNQMYVPTKVIQEYHDRDPKNRKLNASGADERELEEALQRSLKDMTDKEQF